MKKYSKFFLLLMILVLTVSLVACQPSITGIKLGGLKTEYYVGDDFVPVGYLEVTYADGNEEQVQLTAEMCSQPDMTTDGIKTVTVTYGKITETYNINVIVKSAAETVKVTFDYGTTSQFITVEKGTAIELLQYVRSSSDGRPCIGFSANGVTYETNAKIIVDKDVTFVAIYQTSQPEETSLVMSLLSNSFYAVGGFKSGEETTDVVIPATFNGLPVRRVSSYAFEGNETIETVTFEGQIELERGAFKDCANLTTVVNMESITSLGEVAFSGCSSLRAINLGENIHFLHEGTFAGCSSVEEVSVYFTGRSDSIVERKTPYAMFGYMFGAQKFANSYSAVQMYGDYDSDIATYHIPKSLKHITYKGETIPQGAFSGMYESSAPFSMTFVGTKRVDVLAFVYSNIYEVDFGDSIEEIDSNAFSSCYLEKVYLPNTIAYIGNSAFFYCELKEVVIAEDAPLQNIPSYAFCKNVDLAYVRLSKNIVSIGADAFSNCNAMQDLEFTGDQLRTIGDRAFSYCEELLYVDFPSGTFSIGTQAFYMCSNLRSVFLPESMTEIGANAFDSCIRVSFVCEGASQPAGFAENWVGIPRAAWYGRQIKRFGDLLYTEREEGIIIVGYRAHGGEVTIPAQIDGKPIVEIGDYAFRYVNGSEAISKVEFEGEDTITRIGEEAFAHCSDIVSLVLPSNLIEIGARAFVRLTGLRNMVIPISVTTVGERAFGGSFNCILYCEAPSRPAGWHAFWNFYETGTAYYYPTYWGCTNQVLGVFDNQFWYIKENNTIKVTRYVGTNKIVSVPSEIEGQPVVAIGPQFIMNERIQLMFIPSSVTMIEKGGVSSNPHLVVVIANNQEDMQLQETFDTVAVFYGVAESDVQIYNGLYYFVRNQKITILRYIGTDTVVNVPARIRGTVVRTISGRAFAAATTVQVVYIPDTVSEIGSSVFYGCRSGDFVVCIGVTEDQRLFAPSWAKYNDMANGFAPVYYGIKEIVTTDDGFCYFVRDGEATLLRYVGTSENVIIPDSFGEIPLTVVAGYFMHRNTTAKYVKLGANIREVGEYAFAYGKEEKIVVSSSVTSLGNNAFWGCFSTEIFFEHIVLPSSWDMMEINKSNCIFYTGSEWRYDDNGKPIPIKNDAE